MADDIDDDIGDGGENERKSNYRVPPPEYQFKPGKSGNPRGRPKGARGLKAELKAELDRYVTNTKTGKRLRVRRLIINSLAAKAALGDVKAAEKIIALIIQAEGFEPEAPIKRRLTDNDQQILDQFLGEPDGPDGMSIEPESASVAGEQINDKHRATTADGDIDNSENQDDEK